MTWQMLAQSFGIPLLAAAIAYYINRKPLYILTLGFWAATIWLTNFSLHSMTAIAFMLTLTVFSQEIPNAKFPRWLKSSAVIAIGALMYWWMVRRFSERLDLVEWIVPIALIASSYLFSISALKSRTNFSHLAWIAPLGGLALVVSLFGSVKIGVLSGTLASVSLLGWVIYYIRKLDSRELATWIALPSMFIAFLAYHFAEIDPLYLLILFGNWLLIPLLANKKPNVQLITIFIIGIATTEIGRAHV